MAVRTTASLEFGASLAREWICLTLTQNTADDAAAIRSPPLPSPLPSSALRRTAAESRPLAERPPARLQHARGRGGKAGATGCWGCRSSLEGPREEEEKLVMWCPYQAQPHWRVSRRTQPGLPWFPGTEQPPPLIWSAGLECTGLARRGGEGGEGVGRGRGGAGVALSLQHVLLPAMVLLQLGWSDCLHEHIPSLLLSCLTQSVPLFTVLPGDQLCLGWLKQVSVTCHTFAVWGKSNNLAGGGKD